MMLVVVREPRPDDRIVATVAISNAYVRDMSASTASLIRFTVSMETIRQITCARAGYGEIIGPCRHQQPCLRHHRVARLHDGDPCYRVYTRANSDRATLLRQRRLPSETLALVHPEFVDLRTRIETYRCVRGGVLASHSTFDKAKAAHGFFFSSPPNGRCSSSHRRHELPSDSATCYGCGLTLANWDDYFDLVELLELHCLRTMSVTGRSWCPVARDRHLVWIASPFCRFGYENRARGALPLASRLDQPGRWLRVYGERSVRTKSFAAARSTAAAIQTTIPQSTVLAACGFFYLGRRGLLERVDEIKEDDELNAAMVFHDRNDSKGHDAVQCHACDLVLYDWEPMACPWTEHVAWSPECPFVAAERERSRQRRQQKLLRRSNLPKVISDIDHGAMATNDD